MMAYIVCGRRPQPTAARQFTFSVIVCTFLSRCTKVNFTFTYKNGFQGVRLYPLHTRKKTLYNEDVAARRAFTLHFGEWIGDARAVVRTVDTVMRSQVIEIFGLITTTIWMVWLNHFIVFNWSLDAWPMEWMRWLRTCPSFSHNSTIGAYEYFT